MALFRLKEGCASHVEKDVTYEPGEIIESDSDLVALFGPEKFESCSGIPTQPDEDKTLERKKSVEEAAEAGVEDVAPPDDDDDDEDDEVVSLFEIESKLGENVTADFAKAEAADILVLKRGSHYYVADTDMPDRKLVSRALTKTKLNKWLKDNT